MESAWEGALQLILPCVSYCLIVCPHFSLQMIQKNGYDEENLNDGPESSWLGYSLLPKGYIKFTTQMVKFLTIGLGQVLQSSSHCSSPRILDLMSFAL